MKKIKLLIITVVAILGLTGCDSNVKLPTAIENSAKVNSYSYNISLDIKAESIEDLPQEYGIPSGSVEFDFDGKVKREEERVKSYTEITVSYGGMSLKIPTYIDASEKEYDFDLLVATPEIIKGYIEEGKTHLYLSGSGIKNFLKENMTDEEYKEFDKSLQDAYTENPVNTKLVDDFTKSFLAYVDKNSSKVQEFEDIEGLKTSANGVYTITLSKDDIKLIVTEYLSNSDYYNDLKIFVENTYSTTEELPKAQEIIDTFNEALDNFKDLSLVLTFTVKDKFVTGVKFDFASTDLDGYGLSMTYNMEFSDINEDVEISMPDKNADTTLNVIEYLETMMMLY